MPDLVDLSLDARRRIAAKRAADHRDASPHDGVRSELHDTADGHDVAANFAEDARRPADRDDIALHDFVGLDSHAAADPDAIARTPGSS